MVVCVRIPKATGRHTDALPAHLTEYHLHHVLVPGILESCVVVFQRSRVSRDWWPNTRTGQLQRLASEKLTIDPGPDLISKSSGPYCLFFALPFLILEEAVHNLLANALDLCRTESATDRWYCRTELDTHEPFCHKSADEGTKKQRRDMLTVARTPDFNGTALTCHPRTA